MFRLIVFFGLSFVIWLVCSCNILLGNELSQGWSTPSPNAGRSAGLSSEQHWEAEGGVGRRFSLSVVGAFFAVVDSNVFGCNSGIVSHQSARMAGKEDPPESLGKGVGR